MPYLDVPRPRTAQILHWLLAIALGFIGLWQFHIPQFASKFDTFPGDRGDARLVTYLMEHWYRVFQGLANWRSPAMFYPFEGAIGYADLTLGYGIVYSGLRTMGLGIFEAAEFTIILFNFLNYLVCFILLNKVLRFSLFASIAGAAFFAFNSPKLVQLAHVQLQPILFLPLAMIGIVLLVQKRERLSQKQAFGLIALSTLSLAGQFLTGFYHGWFFVFWSSLFLILTLLFTQTRDVVFDLVKRYWPAMIGGIALFCVALIPLVLAYLPIFRLVGTRPYSEIQKLIPIPRSFVLMGHRNYLWGGIASAYPPTNPELQIGIGLIPTIAWLGLIVFAVWFLIRFRNPQPKTNLLFLSQLIIATCLVYLLGVKYWNGYSPWQFVHVYVPGGQVIRGVARHALVMALPMSIAFAFLLHVVIKKISLQTHSTRRKFLLATVFVLTTFGLVEQFGRAEGFDGFSIRAENKHLNRLATLLPDDCSAFYVGLKPPIIHNQFEYQIDAIFVSILKGVPTLNGYTGHLPPNWYFYEVADIAYENNVKQWIRDNQIRGKVCRLFIPEPDIDDPRLFVRQQYLDILRREPDGPGLEAWFGRVNNSLHPGKDSGRVTVSLAILDSPEFLDGGYFVLRLYLATLGRPPLREEFVKDHDAIFGGSTAEIEAKKDALIAEFVQRSEFKSTYDHLNDAVFVKKLMSTASNPTVKLGDQLGSELEAKQKTRAQVVRTFLEQPQTVSAFRNHAFVLMQFFGHLSRDPQEWEYQDRLKTLNATGDYRQLVYDFVYSVEYRKRFGYVN